jgi:hypothetical protein
MPGRRFWQIHLSTALIVMVTAGSFLWFQLRFHSIRNRPVQSEWKVTDGLALRLSSTHSIVSGADPLGLTLELRNDSDHEFVVKKISVPPQYIEFFDSTGKEITSDSVIHHDLPIAPAPRLYAQLRSSECLTHDVKLDFNQGSAASDLTVNTPEEYKVPFGEFTVQMRYHGDEMKFVLDTTSQMVSFHSIFKAPMWTGEALTESIHLTAVPLWTTQRVIVNIACGLALILAAAVASESLIRWRTRRRAKLTAST